MEEEEEEEKGMKFIYCAGMKRAKKKFGPFLDLCVSILAQGLC